MPLPSPFTIFVRKTNQTKNMAEKNYSRYQKNYSENGFWSKVKKAAGKAGAKVIYAALLLYYVATDSNVPFSERAKIYGALGYFILPLDLIPDMIPVLGYSDDLTALLCALKAVWSNITPEIQGKAKDKLQQWFGEVKDADLKLL